MALFAAVNSHGSGRRVAPPGGTEGRISTNPICIGAPTLGDPVVIDFGTSAAAEGKVRAQFQKKQPCPDGWLIDHTGAPCTDPAVTYNEPRWESFVRSAAQAYKGFGLGYCSTCSAEACRVVRAATLRFLFRVGNAAVFILLNPALLEAPNTSSQTDGLAATSALPTPGIPAITLQRPERTCRAGRELRVSPFRTARGISS